MSVIPPVFCLHDQQRQIYALDAHVGDFRDQVLAFKLRQQTSCLWKRLWFSREVMVSILKKTDVLLPIPNSCLRLHHYGVSSALLFAELLQRLHHCPILRKSVKFKRGMEQVKQIETYGQKKLRLQQWIEPLPELTLLKGQRVLVVDDVFNSGATFDVMSQLLEPVQPASLQGLMIAYTHWHGHHFAPCHFGNQWAHWLAYLAISQTTISPDSSVGDCPTPRENPRQRLVSISQNTVTGFASARTVAASPEDLSA